MGDLALIQPRTLHYHYRPLIASPYSVQPSIFEEDKPIRISQFSTRLCPKEIPFEREKLQRIMTDAESAVRFHTLSFILKVVLVSHSILGRPSPNNGHLSAALTLDACANSWSQLPLSSTTIPGHQVSKQFLY